MCLGVLATHEIFHTRSVLITFENKNKNFGGLLIFFELTPDGIEYSMEQLPLGVG
jgi:hypothetical protein